MSRLVDRMVSALVPEHDASLGKVVRRDFDIYPVSGNDANIVFAHLAGEQPEDFVPIVEPDAELCVWQRLRHDALLFDCFLFRHVKGMFAECRIASNTAWSFESALQSQFVTFFCIADVNSECVRNSTPREEFKKLADPLVR